MSLLLSAKSLTNDNTSQHRLRIVVTRGEFAERRQRRDVPAAFRKVADERQYQVELADRIKNVCGTDDIAPRTVNRLRRRKARDLTVTKSGTRELTIVSRGIRRGRLVLHAHFIGLVGGLGRPAAPIGGARQHDRIARTVVNVGEVGEAGGDPLNALNGSQPQLSHSNRRSGSAARCCKALVRCGTNCRVAK
jgi:hypothetical protein